MNAAAQHERGEAPASSPQPEALVIICAWCPDFDPKDPKNAGASHGMCPSCVARWEKGERN